MPYQPFVSILKYSWKETLIIGSPIAISVTSGKLDGLVAGDSDSPFYTTYFLQREDRPTILAYALFANFADGLVLSTSGGAAGIINATMRFSDDVPAGLFSVSTCLIPAMNAWVEGEDLVVPQYQLTAGGVNPYVSINGEVDTDIIDTSFAGKDVNFHFMVKLMHNFRLGGA